MCVCMGSSVWGEGCKHPRDYASITAPRLDGRISINPPRPPTPVCFRLGHSTVQSIVLEVCEAIISNMKEETIPTPKKEDWERISNEFWEIWNFPNCIGALDGKHVVIEAPPNSGSLYFNYKKTFSIVLLALVDARYKFIAVDIGAYGKNSDGGILSHSYIGKALENNKINIPSDRELPGTDEKLPYVFIGDEAFPFKNDLLRPYPSPQIYEDEQKKKYSTNGFQEREKLLKLFLDKLLPSSMIHNGYLGSGTDKCLVGHVLVYEIQTVDLVYFVVDYMIVGLYAAILVLRQLKKLWISLHVGGMMKTI
ncbi:hypothetical protein QTP88_010288 [Uroleucon formosanum]